jgi:hypothetical protein
MTHLVLKAHDVKLGDQSGAYEVVKTYAHGETVCIWFERIGLNRNPDEINGDVYRSGEVDGFYEALSPSDDVQVTRPA